MECQGRGKEITVGWEDFVMEGIKAGNVTVSLSQLTVVGFFLRAAVPGGVAIAPKTKGLFGHVSNEPSIPMLGGFQTIVSSGVAGLSKYPIFGKFAAQKMVPSNRILGLSEQHVRVLRYDWSHVILKRIIGIIGDICRVGRD